MSAPSVALGIVYSDAGDDLTAALATLPAAKPYVLHPAELAGVSVDAGVTTIVAQWRDRDDAVRLVRRAAGADVVVVLASDERPDPALTAALRALAEAPSPGVHRARVLHRFLGRDIGSDPVAVAWCGGDDTRARPRLLDGTLVRLGAGVTGTIGRLDADATRIAACEAAPDTATAAAPARLTEFVTRPGADLIRRLWSRRADGVPGVILSLIESYGGVLAAAKRWERRALLEQHLVTPSGLPVPDGFVSVKTPAGWMVVRRDVDERLLATLHETAPDAAPGVPVVGGGRGGAWMLAFGNGGGAVLRWYRRGGVFRGLLHDRYFGVRPRPLVELAVTEEARRRGVATAEVLGARVDRLRLGFYRGVIVTRTIEQALTLGEALRRPLPQAERDAMLRAVAAAVRRMHERGVHHRDLNVANVLVVLGQAGPTVHLIDFDRARLGTVSERTRRRALRRLDRSFLKLNREAEVISAAERAALEHAYWGSV